MESTSATPVSSLMTLAVIAPDGQRSVLGHVYKHRNRFLQAIIGTPLRWQLDYNTARHNRRMEKR